MPTPAGWVEASLRDRAGLRYEQADGTDPVGVFDAAEDLAEHVRATGRPAVLHLRTVRFGGHAGTDVESAYRTAAGDPCRARPRPAAGHGARARRTHGAATPADLVDRYLDGRAAVRARAMELAERPPLRDGGRGARPARAAPAGGRGRSGERRRRRRRAGRRSSAACPRTRGRSRSPSRSTARSATCSPPTDRVLVFGEDVGAKGGVYGVTRGLQRKAGGGGSSTRCSTSSRSSAWRSAPGVSGLVPIPEIQYLAYLHNAEDQLRGEAASLAFFSNGQYTNPLVVRIAGYGYQKGFGGHFHNDNGVAVLRDIPGLVIASPAHPADAPAMLRTCVAAAVTDGTVSVFLEPIALYHTRDLHEPGDERWTAPYAAPARVGAASTCRSASPAVARDGDDVLVVTWANGLYLSLRVAERLAADGHRLPRARPALAGAAADRRGRPPRPRRRPGGRRRRDPAVGRRR